MPVYNESRTLRTILRKVLAVDLDVDIEVVCVNDGSTDDSAEILDELAAVDPRILVVHQPSNQGKGLAIRAAIAHMTGDLAIIQDADLEYDPNDYHKVLQPLLDGKADAVYGSRFAASEQRRVLFFWHALGNRLLTTLSNMANDLNLTDMETCYKAFRGELLKSLRLTSDRFGLEPEVTARLAQWGARIYEVPISYHGRTYAEGKNIGWRDGLEALWLIFKFRFLDTRATDDQSSATRQSVGKAPRFRRWILGQFGDSLGQHVLEVNPGPGHLTSHLLDRATLQVIEESPNHHETLVRRFGHLENVSIQHGTIDSFAPAPNIDTLIVFDDLQRVLEPKTRLAEIAALGQSGSKVLLHVPAGADLFGPADRSAGHLRRFDKDQLRDVISAAGLELVDMTEFNKLGWWLWRLHHLFGMESISSAEARAFDLLVPLAARIDLVSRGAGLSLVAVARIP